MSDKLFVLLFFTLLLSVLYALTMRATPHRGFLRAIETACAGAALCLLCQWLLAPLGVQIAQSPLAALSAGYWGIPGVALATALSLWP